MKKGDAVVVPKKDGKLALLKSARAYTDDLQARIVAKASKVSGRPVDSRDWQLLRWLRDKDEDNSVGRGLSLVLNALVRLSTTKSFELLASFVREHVTVEVRQLENHVPAWFYLRERAFEDLDEYLVSFPELFLDGDVLKPDVDDILHQLLHVRCQHKYEVLRVEHTDGVIRVTLRDRATIVQYPKGAICGCIPVPGARPRKEARQEPEGINAPEVVVTSAVVGNALEQLSRVWQDPYAKSVLISSPPGSGKEVFASSIPIGNGRPPEKIFAMSMASEDQRGLERRLYGAMR